VASVYARGHGGHSSGSGESGEHGGKNCTIVLTGVDFTNILQAAFCAKVFCKAFLYL